MGHNLKDYEENLPLKDECHCELMTSVVPDRISIPHYYSPKSRRRDPPLQSSDFHKDSGNPGKW